MHKLRLLSFSYDGRTALGAIIDGGVLDVSARLGADFVSLREVVAQQRLDTIRKAIAVADPDYSLDEIWFYAPIPIFSVGCTIAIMTVK